MGKKFRNLKNILKMKLIWTLWTLKLEINQSSILKFEKVQFITDNLVYLLIIFPWLISISSAFVNLKFKLL